MIKLKPGDVQGYHPKYYLLFVLGHFSLALRKLFTYQNILIPRQIFLRIILIFTPIESYCVFYFSMVTLLTCSS